MLESEYQARLIKKLHDKFPGAIIIKNPSNYLQGIPDLTIFYYNCWATLEVKTSADAAEQPNQRYYVDKMNEMSFSRFVYPANEKEVLRDLQHAFVLHGEARTAKSKPVSLDQLRRSKARGKGTLGRSSKTRDSSTRAS